MKLAKNQPKNKILGNDQNILGQFINFRNLYLNYKNSINISSNTEKNINLVLDRFYDYVADELDENENLTITDINKYFLSAYLNRLSDNGISKNTQKLHLTIIKNFLTFISDYDVQTFGLLKTQINGLKIRVEQKEKKYLTESEQQRLKIYLAKLDTEKSFISHRNSLIIKLLLYTGARISEILDIKWADISEVDDKDHGLVYVILINGKGSKERYAYILYSEIQDNIECIKKNMKNEEYLIVSTHANKCDRSNIYSEVDDIMQEAGIQKTGLHMFRHTYARNLVNQNVNLATIKELLGHANISVTAQFYAKSNEKAKFNASVQNYKR